MTVMSTTSEYGRYNEGVEETPNSNVYREGTKLDHMYTHSDTFR